MKYGQFLKAVERGNVLPFTGRTLSDLAGKSWKAYVNKVAEEVRGAQKFEMDYPVTRDSLEEVSASAEAMMECGVYRLPFPVCWLEYSTSVDVVGGKDTQGKLKTAWGMSLGDVHIYSKEAKDTGKWGELVRFDSSGIRVGALVTREYNRELYKNMDWKDTATLGGYYYSKVFLCWPDMSGSRVWRDIGMDITCKGDAVLPKNVLVSVAPYLYTVDRDVGYLLKTFAYTSAIEVMTMIVLLATKGVSVDWVPRLRKYSRMPLRSRQTPENGHSIIRVYKACQESTRATGCTPVNRSRVRLHMRRGHVRRQRYGRKCSKVKLVFIEPTLVGYEEEGRLKHEYEVFQD